MSKRLLAQVGLLMASCAALSTAAPSLSLGSLSLNKIGVSSGPDGQIEFRIMNWTGLQNSDFATPITFQNVQLTLTWVDVAPANITGPLEWYRDGDEAHMGPTFSASMPPSIPLYESTRLRRSYGIRGGTLRMDLSPGTTWNLSNGGTYTPPSSTFELVFTLPQADGLMAAASADEVLPVWDLFLASDVPEPATYFMGAIGLAGIWIGRRYRRAV